MSVWNCCIMAIKVGGQPYLLRNFQRRFRLTVSNAYVRSAKDMYKSSCISRYFSCSCRDTNIMSIVLRPRRKQHSGSDNTTSTTWSRRHLSMILARTLPAIEIREIPRLLSHSTLSPFYPCKRIMLAPCHCCGRQMADQQSRIKSRSLL